MKPNIASRQALMGMFGSLNGVSLLLITVTLILMGIVTNLAFAALVATLRLEGWIGFVAALVVGSLTLFGAVYGFWRLAARTGNRSLQSKPEKPKETDVLVMYLSPIRTEKHHATLSQLLASDSRETCTELVQDIPWYMNLEGIRNQLQGRVDKNPLKVVMLRTQDVGTEQLNEFRQVASQVLPQDANMSILDAWEYCPDDIKVPQVELNSDDLSRQFDLVEVIRQHADQNKDRVLIDVTSGTKVCSIAAAMVSLYKDQHFQYVHFISKEEGCKVQSYNVQYSEDD